MTDRLDEIGHSNGLESPIESLTYTLRDASVQTSAHARQGFHIVSIDGIQQRGFRPILSRSEIDQALVDARSLPTNTLGPNYSAWYWTVMTSARSNDFAGRLQAIRDIRQRRRPISDAMRDVLEHTTRAVIWEIRVANSCDTNEGTRMLETALDR